MSIVDRLRWQTFSTVQDESWSTEAKSGVPRYDGDVAKLAEYQFRVRLRQAREKAMDESELKKLGPLALRLVDGLRGPALQVARGLPVDQLAKDEGTCILLALQTLQPSKQARDLYQVGARSVEPADRRKHSLCSPSQSVQLDGHGRLVEAAAFRHTGANAPELRPLPLPAHSSSHPRRDDHGACLQRACGTAQPHPRERDQERQGTRQQVVQGLPWQGLWRKRSTTVVSCLPRSRP